MKRWLLAVVALLLWIAPPAPAAQAAPPIAVTLERRGQERAETVDVLRWDRDGLEVRRGAPNAPVAFVRWDEVRTVDGMPAESLEAQRLGERLWRARTRIERGDFALAAPLLEELAAIFQGEGSRRERIAIEGVLRTRVRAGDPAAAILAALRAMELDRANVLLPPGALAPAERIASLDWPEGAAILPLEGLLEKDEADALLASLGEFAAEDRAVAIEAAAIAEAALGQRLAASLPANRSSLASLLRRLAEVRAASPATLLADRERLLEEASPAAIERWWQAHLGERLLADSAPSVQRRGLLEWLAVAAGEPDSPEARIALRRAVRAADRLGEDDLADRLAVLASETATSAAPAPRDPGTRP
jgi:hypothetical protein